ncbi:MAG TPA: YbhB/YbcL family Raf kinase inhibitor-like protein [Polyangiaceae bacterium]|nr:YbhB/YbcL family Raf kinase inhibitor-like protein [Polyangiaceae bacterium]
MQLRFLIGCAIGGALGVSSVGCSSDEAGSPGTGGSGVQAGSAGETSMGGGGSSAGTGGAGGSVVTVMSDASIDVIAPAIDADLGMREASSGDQRSTEASGPFALTSTVFKEGEDVPAIYRCTDQNVSPPLSWTSGPAATQSYAVMMVHFAADMSIHWALWDIAASVTSLPMGVERVTNPTVPAGSKQVKTNIDASTWAGYTGPCPGSANQKYEYSVYALDVAPLPGVTVQSTTAQVDTAIKAHQLARATLTGSASK